MEKKLLNLEWFFSWKLIKTKKLIWQDPIRTLKLISLFNHKNNIGMGDF